MKKLSLLVLLLILVISCSKESENLAYYNVYELFNTVSSIYLYTENADEVYENIYAIMDKYHKLLDIYNEYEDLNNLKTVNKNAGNKPVKVDVELLDLLTLCKEFYNITHGKLDISFGAVLSMWHNYRENMIIPNEDELYKASFHTGFDKIVIDYENSTVFITDEKASIDVGAVGKGFVCEKIASYLDSINVSNYALNIGGNVKLSGVKPNNENWVTGIRDPSGNAGILLKLSVTDLSIVTSGGYERFYEVSNMKYHHIIDTETLFPALYYDSVTIISENSLIADLLSTALLCTDMELGKETLSRVKELYKLNTLEAVWIKESSVMKTDGVKEFEKR